jgi:large subunit ribosomal protein L15
MPIARRVPKRGFNHNAKKVYVIVNLADLADLAEGTVVDYGFVMENGLAKAVKNNSGLKVLGDGELNVALTVRAAKFSASAKAAIEAAKGTAETL